MQSSLTVPQAEAIFRGIKAMQTLCSDYIKVLISVFVISVERCFVVMD